MAKPIGYVVEDDGTMRPLYEQEPAETEADTDPFEEPEPVDYSSWKKADLEAEVATRNDGLEPDDEGYVLVGGKGTVADLVAALEADDADQ